MKYYLIYWDNSANKWRRSVVSPIGGTDLNTVHELRARYTSYDYYVVVEETDLRYIAARNNGGYQ